MKKLIVSAFALFLTSAAIANRWDSSLEYRTSKDFNQFTAQIQSLVTLDLSAGLRARVSDEKALKDPVYSLYIPVEWNNNMMKFNFTPFYYFKNKIDTDRTLPGILGAGVSRDSSAFGANANLFITLQEDTINELYTHAYLGVGFVRQKGILFTETDNPSSRYYSQTAYTLGFHKNFFRAFSFEVAGNAFQYPDGITDVKGFYGVFNQQDIASIQSFDITHELPKYTVGTRLTRLWPEQKASLYLAYHFEEFHTADPEHSFILGNTFALTENISADIAYNHLRTVHNQDKRDIFYIQTHFFF
jgi:hypothetical protein